LHGPAIAHAERSAHRPVQALDAWLVVLIAALFLLERVLAMRPSGKLP
jgi:hypothetical protein